MVIIWCAAALLSIDSGVLIPTCTCAKVMSCSRQAGRQAGFHDAGVRRFHSVLIMTASSSASEAGNDIIALKRQCRASFIQSYHTNCNASPAYCVAALGVCRASRDGPDPTSASLVAC